MSFLSRRYRFCDGTCHQGHQQHTRELLTATASSRLTHNSPVSESDIEDDNELFSYVPMNFFIEQGHCSKSSSQNESDFGQLPDATFSEQFLLGEGDRKWEMNKLVQDSEQNVVNGRNPVSGDIFQWGCSPQSSQGTYQEKDTLNLIENKKTLRLFKKSLGTGRLKSGLGKIKNYPMTSATEEEAQIVPTRNYLMVVGTSCETFNKKDRISFMMEN